jgi:DNA-binding CsgD family transcriptional regulator
MIPIPRELMGLLEAAAAQSLPEYEHALFELLARHIQFDVAFCVRADGPGQHAPGLDARVRQQTLGRFGVYAAEYAEFERVTLLGTGVGVDRAFFGARALERLHTYDELMRPVQGRSTLVAFLGSHAERVGTLVLGRKRGEFSAQECATLTAARPLIAVCERALALPRCCSPKTSALCAEPVPAFSPRELELLRYLRLGYTNREIAAACGTSFRTVRNQLTRVFDKLGASTRAEAVTRTFELALPLDS